MRTRMELGSRILIAVRKTTIWAGYTASSGAAGRDIRYLQRERQNFVMRWERAGSRLPQQTKAAKYFSEASTSYASVLTSSSITRRTDAYFFTLGIRPSLMKWLFPHAICFTSLTYALRERNSRCACISVRLMPRLDWSGILPRERRWLSYSLG